MVSKNENKGLFLGVAAATAFIGAALLYHFVFTDGDEERAAVGIEAELAAAGLDEVMKSPSGQGLEPEYMLKLLQFVTSTGKERRAAERKDALDQRRQNYKNKDWDAYRNLVKEQFMAEDTMCQAIMAETVGVLDTTEQEFGMTMQMMAQNPQY